MGSEKRLIDANEVERKLRLCISSWGRDCNSNAPVITRTFEDALQRVVYAPTVDAVELPCKIGDFVWAIRNFHGHKHPQRGIVSDMYFLKDMSLQIVVKYVARGKWGETVFATDKEAYAAIEERKDNAI